MWLPTTRTIAKDKDACTHNGKPTFHAHYLFILTFDFCGPGTQFERMKKKQVRNKTRDRPIRSGRRSGPWLTQFSIHNNLDLFLFILFLHFRVVLHVFMIFWIILLPINS